MDIKKLNSCQKNQSNMKDKYCIKCDQVYKNTLSCSCGLCGKRLVVLTDNMPHCPSCNSLQVTKISATSRALHGVAFGLFSKTARSQFECKNCGYKW